MISDTQKGAIAENLVCNWLMRCSDGRLSPYKPVADDGGIDVLVFDRKTRRTLLLQVKSRVGTDALADSKRNPQFHISIKTFTESHDFYIAAILLGSDLQTPIALWLIPSGEIHRRCRRAGKQENGQFTKLRLSCAPSQTTGDKWSGYKSHAVDEFVSRICEVLDCQ